MSFLAYPFLIFRYWYLEAPVSLLRYFRSLNVYMVNLLSVPLLIGTFFKPLKNEYRTGLIGFSIGMGVTSKSFLLLMDLLMILFLAMFEIIFLFGFLIFPFFAFYLFVL